MRSFQRPLLLFNIFTAFRIYSLLIQSFKELKVWNGLVLVRFVTKEYAFFEKGFCIVW